MAMYSRGWPGELKEENLSFWKDENVPPARKKRDVQENLFSERRVSLDVGKGGGQVREEIKAEKGVGSRRKFQTSGTGGLLGGMGPLGGEIASNRGKENSLRSGGWVLNE